MYSKKHPSDALLQLARKQAGVLTRQQLKSADAPTGAHRRWIDDWTRMWPGIYCMHEPAWESWCRAALLRTGDSGVITGAAAGFLHGFVDQQPKLITIYHPSVEGLPPMGDADVTVRIRRGVRAGRGDLRRTSVEEALMDLARESTEAETISAVARAIAQELTVPSRVLDALSRRARMRHRTVLEQVCSAAGTGVQSVLEWYFMERVIRAHGLPEPDRQLSLVEGTRSDGYWTAHGLAVELDGKLGHEEEPFRDMHRDNRLAIRGDVTVRYGWHDSIVGACAASKNVAAALSALGWEGERRCCRDCLPSADES